MSSIGTRNSAPLVALAAGGTGGHMFPAEALAGALLARGFRVALVTDSRGQAFGGGVAVEVHRIRASRLPRHMVDRLKAVLEMGLGVLDARSLLRRLSPAVVVGFGGYPSIPTVLAGSMLGVPVVLHEQNALLGRANRRLARRAAVIATSFHSVAKVPSGVTCRLVGNPVRLGVTVVRERPYVSAEAEGSFRLLVLGGSQGARIFSEIIPTAAASLPESIRTRLRIVQQCRPEDIESARAAYAAAGLSAELATFFSDVPERLAECHLAITRSGASTVAELAVAGRPAILVPYPFATDDHQSANAAAHAASGAAWVMPQRDLTAAALAARLTELANDPATLTRAAALAWDQGRPDAAERFADLVAEQASRSLPAASARPDSKDIAA